MAFVDLDETDKAILRILLIDARTPYSRIARMLGLSEATVYLRVKRLKDKGILRGFYADIDAFKIGFNVLAFVLIKADPRRYKEVLERLREIKNIVELYEVTGEYMGLAKIRARTQEELVKTIDEIGGVEGVTATYTMYVLKVLKEEKRLNI
ncbi:MAG TPA: Lrp/AsnC family transcriptional regulator [Desulfurococcaceae archaeon]|nr:Lrp/AsnC family transcriptional regulator [Desulfurococcaceae archaeon]